MLKKGSKNSATVTDDARQVSTNACQTSLDTKNPFPSSPTFYGGKERLSHDEGPGAPGSRCAALACRPQVGIQPKIGDKAELEAAVGLNVEDTENTSIFADLAVNGLLGKAFSGGVSAWDLTRSNGSRGVTLLLPTGLDLTSNGKWPLAQGRAPFEQEIDKMDNNYMVWGGVRFRVSSK